jgi:hypothetical protein
MLHILQWLYTYVASVFFKCFSCFHLDVACFHMDVAYVAVAIHVCCKCMFQMFYLFQDIRCKCFIWMLHMLQWLYTYVTNVCFNCFTFVSVCCNMCYSPRALTRGQARAAQGAPTPSGVIPLGGACRQHNTCACYAPSPSLSHWGTHVVLYLALGHTRCDPSLACN